MRRLAIDYRNLILADGPVGYWRLGEASGNVADSSGNANTGTASGAIVYGVPGAILDGTLAVTLSSTAMFFTLASTFQFATNIPGLPFTVEAWVKFTSTLQQMVFSNRFGSTGVYFGTSTGKVFAYFHNGATGLTGPTLLNDNAWHHIALTWDGLTRVMYLDGRPEIRDTPALASGPASASASLCDDINPGDFWDGSVDEVAVYAKTLSAGRILQHYQAALVRGGSRLNYAPVVKFDKPVAYWRLGEASGSFVEQISANNGAANGTLARAQDGAVADGDLACGFDGSTGFISFAGVNVSQGDFTLEAWVKPTGFPNGHNHVLTGASGCPAMDVSQSGIFYATEISNADAPLSGATVPLNVWSHLAITFLKAGQVLGYYINGVLAASPAWPGYIPGNATAHTRIGLTSNYASAWQGLIDEAAIYNYALSTAQLLDHFLMGTSGRRTRVAA